MTDRPARTQEIDLLCQRFRQFYGREATGVLRAPARINVLGEHVDYVSYLPTASLIFGSAEHAMLMAFRAADDDQVRGLSLNDRFDPFAFSLNDGPQDGQPWADWLYARPVPAPHWSNYVRGAVFFAGHARGGQIRRGFDFVVASTIPAKAGASSSSALTVLAGAAIRLVNEIGYDRHDLARESAQAEWFVGTRGGAMDHTAICLSERGRAVHLSYANDSTETVPLPDEGYRWVTFFTHEADKGSEVMLEYNERAAVARLLIPAILAKQPDPGSAIDALPESITLDQVAQLYPQTFAGCQLAFPALVRERGLQDLKIRDRARHHLGEAQRVATAVAILRERGDVTAKALRLGRLLDDAHISLRDLYQVSTPEVERMIEAIRADRQVCGARLMGGGFGGNVLALTRAENAAELIERVQRDYYGPRNRHGLSEGAVMISTPGDGLAEIK